MPRWRPLVDGSDDIKWSGHNMDPGNVYVDTVEDSSTGDGSNG
jgi:hypothetical protein